MTDYIFGELPGNPVGTIYESREAAKNAGVHQVGVQGIAGNRHVGCASIVLNGGYGTDEDYGHEIFYTGSGGQDPQNRKRHIADQDLDASDNAALVTSEQTGEPIRIVRGWKGDPDVSPTTGYRYDGLYKVIKHYSVVPDDGFRRWIFHLVQLVPSEAAEYVPAENAEANALAFAEYDLGSGTDVEDTAAAATPEAPLIDPFFGKPAAIIIPAGKTDPGTTTVISQRVIRDTKVTAAVKAMYANTCQICGTQLATKNGYYSEGAHVRPLGRPHHGPDTMPNILCLCPNHHAAFDKGGIYIADDLCVYDTHGEHIGTLNVHADHDIDVNNARYHRTHHGHVAEAGIQV